MKNEKYILLIYKKLKGGLSDDELSQLDQWVEKSEEHREVYQGILKSWELSEDYEPDFKIDAEADFEAFIRPKMYSSPLKEGGKRVQMTNRRKWWAVAAAIVFLVGCFYFFFQTPQAEILTVQTQEDDIQEIVLPDGSIVWLNENSVLEYPSFFSSNTRKVMLKGEAFYEVQHKPDQPFIVETPNTQVTVLGTSFNVKARAEDALTKVTVSTGKVQFATKDETKKVVLTKNETASYNHSDQSINSPSSTSLNALVWKTQKLSFRNVPLKEVLPVLEEYFEVKFTIEHPALGDCTYTMPSRKANLDEILDNFIKLFKIEVEQQGSSNYLIKGGNC